MWVIAVFKIEIMIPKMIVNKNSEKIVILSIKTFEWAFERWLRLQALKQKLVSFVYHFQKRKPLLKMVPKNHSRERKDFWMNILYWNYKTVEQYPQFLGKIVTYESLFSLIIWKLSASQCKGRPPVHWDWRMVKCQNKK